MDPEEKVFDRVPYSAKVTLPQHLSMESKVMVKKESPAVSAPASTVSEPGFVPSGQRPRPSFVSSAKLEQADSTIPWETPAGRRGGRREGPAMASHHCHREVTKVAHHPSPDYLPCFRPNPCRTSSSLPTSVTTEVTVWCHRDDSTCPPLLDATDCLVGRDGAASPAPPRQGANQGQHDMRKRARTRSEVDRCYHD